MTDTPRVKRLSARIVLPIIAVLVLAADYARRHDPERRPDPAPVERLDGFALAERLRSSGLDLRVVCRHGERSPCRNAYLTATDATWRELERRCKSGEDIDAWAGTVFVELVGREGYEDRVAIWGDCCLVSGPFLFFGDPELLGQLDAALAE